MWVFLCVWRCHESPQELAFCLVPLDIYYLWWWLWLCSFVHSAAWCWTPPLLHCFPCHELVFTVFPRRGLSPWHETKGSHSQGPQATQVCSFSPYTLQVHCSNKVQLYCFRLVWFCLCCWSGWSDVISQKCTCFSTHYHKQFDQKHVASHACCCAL